MRRRPPPRRATPVWIRTPGTGCGPFPAVTTAQSPAARTAYVTPASAVATCTADAPAPRPRGRSRSCSPRAVTPPGSVFAGPRARAGPGATAAADPSWVPVDPAGVGAGDRVTSWYFASSRSAPTTNTAPPAGKAANETSSCQQREEQLLVARGRRAEGDLVRIRAQPPPPDAASTVKAGDGDSSEVPANVPPGKAGTARTCTPVEWCTGSTRLGRATSPRAAARRRSR
jgi:hypothetical protein